MRLNETPVRTSKNFGINNIDIKEIETNKKIEEFNKLTISGDTSEVEISQDTKKFPLIYGVGKDLEQQVYEKSNHNIKLKFNNSKNKNIYLEFCFDEVNSTLIDNIEIIANKNAKATIVIKYITEELQNYHNNENTLKQSPQEYYNNGIVRVTAEDGSEVNVLIINMLNNQSNNLLSIENNLYGNGIVNYTIVDFGGKNSITNYYSNLIGNEAKSDLNTIYLGSEEQLFDFNYIAELRGQRTNANIEVQGALKDNAKKNFKGTIDFKTGCKKAIGSENEFCMLLSDRARSKALPILLCAEEDVEGSHSSASGKIDENMLFYIMSRGFSYKEAMKLIVKAKFNDILENIKNKELKDEIIREIDRKLD